MSELQTQKNHDCRARMAACYRCFSSTWPNFARSAGAVKRIEFCALLPDNQHMATFVIIPADDDSVSALDVVLKKHGNLGFALILAESGCFPMMERVGNSPMSWTFPPKQWRQDHEHFRLLGLCQPRSLGMARTEHEVTWVQQQNPCAAQRHRRALPSLRSLCLFFRA